MATFATNLTRALEERLPDLAAAGDTDAVKTIVHDAAQVARLRTQVPETFVYRATVVVLGLSVLAVIIGQLWLAHSQIDVPEGVIAIGSAAIGALAGLLAPTPAK